MTGTSQFRGANFDVDGVLVDSPHELAWREAFRDLMEGDWADIRDQTSWTAERFTPAVYQQVMAGEARLGGARGGLGELRGAGHGPPGGPDAAGQEGHRGQPVEEGRVLA